MPALEVVPPPALLPFDARRVAAIRAIFAASDQRQDDVFMKVGDSSTVSRGFLECFDDEDEVDLAGRTELEETLAFFRAGRAGPRSPFRRESLAAAEGWSARHVLSGRPPPIVNELTAIRPRWALVMNGGNDVEGHDAHQYGTRMLRIVRLLVERGVVPVLNSIPARSDDAEADAWVSRYNQVSWAISEALALPYLDYHQVMQPLPRHGLAADGVHPNIFVEGSRGHGCRFDDEGLAFGHNARNLLALRGLDAMRRGLVAGEEPAPTGRERPQGDGTTEAPFDVRSLPLADWRDTTSTGSQAIAAYEGCDAPQDESGRELVYRLVLDAPLTVRVLAIGTGDADVDVHLLRSEPTGARCVARDDRELVHHLEPGVWFVSVDTFSDSDGPRGGEVLVLIAPSDEAAPDEAAPEQPPPEEAGAEEPDERAPSDVEADESVE